MLNVRLAGDHLCGRWLFPWLSLTMYLMVPSLCCPFSHEMSGIRSGAKLSQFLRIFLPTLIPIEVRIHRYELFTD